MPTNLNKLRVSLTKHGAHKVAYLIEKFDRQNILKHVAGDYNSIIIDYPQAHKILSAENGIAPKLWDQIKNYGQEDIFDLVFVSNVFSHIDLINTMSKGMANKCIIKRGDVIDGKAFTNFAHTIDQFGYSIEHTPDFISFDISRIFQKYYLSTFIFKIIGLKLTEAGWDKSNDLIDECLKLNFNNVFGLSSDDFKTWLHGNALDTNEIQKLKVKRNFKEGIRFKRGHRSKFEGKTEKISVKTHTAILLHNQIQNNVFKLLEHKYPKDEIGTEVQTNTGLIDIVRKKNGKLIFYEIKTSDDIRTNIRDGLSQLLEYAYWNKIKGIEELIIIGPSAPKPEAIQYLEKLRNKFNIPIYYKYYDLRKNTLSESV